MKAAPSLAIAALAVGSCCPPPAPVTPTPPVTPPVVAPTPPTPPPPPPAPEPITVIQTAQPQDLIFPEEAFRAEQPRPGPARPFRLPRVQNFRLPSGIQVYLVEQHTLPVISLDLTFDGGSVADPPGKEGLASVCMAMMSEGTTQLDKIQFSEALADVASSVGSYAGADTQGVSMATLTKHLDVTFGLFVDTLRHPGFRADDLDRMIKRRLEGLKQAKGNPGAVASRVDGPILYGAHHPYGRIVTEASLKAITLDDCRAYHARWVRPRNARLFVVGDLTAAQIRERFGGAALADWTGAVPALPRLPRPAKRTARIYFVDLPGAAQSQVGFAHFGPLRTAPDYVATALMTAVLGGSFTSRINMNLREDKGYTYGARAGYHYSRHYGVMTAGASVRADATYQSLLELHDELMALHDRKRPATTEELTREKASAVLGLPSRFATAVASLGMFRQLVYYGLPLGYWNRYSRMVEKTSPAQVARTAARHLHPADAVYLVIGDGSAPMIVRDGDADLPLTREGHQLTLREALALLAAERTLGAGALVELDADALPVAPAP